MQPTRDHKPAPGPSEDDGEKNKPDGAEATRREILAQHATLRELLRDLSQVMQEVVHGQGPPLVRLRALVSGLRSQLERHMAFEEEFLVRQARSSIRVRE